MKALALTEAQNTLPENWHEANHNAKIAGGRLATIQELTGHYDYADPHPGHTEGFIWSGEVYARDRSLAWGMNLFDGSLETYCKNERAAYLVIAQK